jgi:hypothetical protein
MKSLMALVVCCVFAGVLQAQDDTQSVLVNPPPQVQQVQPQVQVPQVTCVLRRGFFGYWRVEPVVPVQFVLARPPPRPVVVWTPWVVWR